ncbi:Eco57I restriction-modification methylase domain-containing protein [Aquirufa nivalisilvae]
MLQTNYNPDVLSCIANLSNDEVFTPPSLANEILDVLPIELWSNPKAKFLDPVTKSGVFLREIAKRLMKGLETQIPDKQVRINHIFTQQLYGIAITDLTALLSRRSVYCSKTANSRYSICDNFTDEQGNIHYTRMKHSWQDGKCTYCGANEDVYDRFDVYETYAYNFIHTDNPYDIFNMKFDVIVGNPPYQLGDGGNNASATPIYNLFVDQAKKLNPNYLIMIIPARWYAGGRGLETFRSNMLTDKKLREIHDFKDPSDCFPGIRVGGGVCYFLWDKNYKSNLVKVIEHSKGEIRKSETRPTLEDGLSIFIRDSIVHSILKKANLFNELKLSSIAFKQKPYGFRTNFTDFDKNGDVKVYTKKSKEGFSFVKKEKILKNEKSIGDWKVVTSRSTSVPEEDNGQVLRISQTFIAEPNSVVTESYVIVGTFKTEIEAQNCLSYLKTRFFRLLCQMTIVSPDVSQRTFDLVPIQDFKESWNDKKLYKKYNLNLEEITYLEAIIREV